MSTCVSEGSAEQNIVFNPFQSFWNSRNFVSKPLELVSKLLELLNFVLSFRGSWKVVLELSETHFRAFEALGISFWSFWSSWKRILKHSEL